MKDLYKKIIEKYSKKDNKTEKEFYKLFKIKPLKTVCYRGFDNCINNDYNCHCHNKNPCSDSTPFYPSITDDIYFKLIFYISIEYIVKIESCYNIQELRENILKSCINYITSDKITNKRKEQFLNQVQKLFIESEVK